MAVTKGLPQREHSMGPGKKPRARHKFFTKKKPGWEGRLKREAQGSEAYPSSGKRHDFQPALGVLKTMSQRGHAHQSREDPEDLKSLSIVRKMESLLRRC